MQEKLQHIEDRFNDLTEQLSDPDIVSNIKKLKDISKERAQLEPIIEKYHELQKTISNIDEAKEIIAGDEDADMKEMAKEELDELKPELEKINEDLKILLVPKDLDDDKDIYLEIRAGTGGDEAGLFANDLLRMYQRYAEKQKWSFSIVSYTDTGSNVLKEAVISVTGESVYSKMKFESGVHRVQRVPQTESQGRVHTSAASVAVLAQTEPEEIEINQNDLRIDTYHSSGAGGQHVNTSDSAIRITHLPTNTVVTCQNERSQLKNKLSAMKMLASRLQEMENAKVHGETSEVRKSQVGSGDRSAKIRTYNFPQGRVSDHRIGLTLYKLDAILNGDLDDIIEPLLLADRTQKLKGETK